MVSLNKVMLIGNLTRDPELRYIPSGTALCEVGLAVNRRFKSQSGDFKEDVCFVEVVIWGKQAEFCAEYFKKGKQMFVEGRLQLDQWKSKEGENRSKLRVVAEQLQFVGPKSSSENGGDSGGGGSRGGRGRDQEPAPPAADPTEPVPDTPPVPPGEDLPF